MSRPLSNKAPQGLSLLGVNHKTAPLTALERLALSADEVQAVYLALATHREIEGALVLSTCNRTELYAAGREDADVRPLLKDALVQVIGTERLPQADAFYDARGKDGVRHLFSVTAGLDSLVLGENQIVGQVKDALNQSAQHYSSTTAFARAVQAALQTAGKSRAQTDIAKGAVSVASAGVHLATRIYSDLSSRTVVVVGAGETSRLAAEHFATHKPKRLLVLNRTLEKAQTLAQHVDGEAQNLSTLPQALAEADVVCLAVRVQEPLVTRAMLEQAMHHRGGRPLVVLDLGLPRNVDAAANQLPNVFANDLTTLRQVMDKNLGQRQREVPKVQALIESDVDKFLAAQRATQVGPLIADLRASVEALCDAEVQRVSKDLSAKEREAAERATRAVLNKLLHGPMTIIRTLAAEGRHDKLQELSDAVAELRVTAGEPKNINASDDVPTRILVKPV